MSVVPNGRGSGDESPVTFPNRDTNAFAGGTMKRTFFAGVVLCLVMCSGCGDSVDPNRPKTYPVSGTVTQGGQPVADANVTFHSKDGSRGAVGVTDANGNFQLTTFTAGDGAVAGEHEVSITKYDQPKITPKGDGSIGDTGDEPETPEEKGAARGVSRIRKACCPRNSPTPRPRVSWRR